MQVHRHSFDKKEKDEAAAKEEEDRRNKHVPQEARQEGQERVQEEEMISISEPRCCLLASGIFFGLERGVSDAKECDSHLFPENSKSSLQVHRSRRTIEIAVLSFARARPF